MDQVAEVVVDEIVDGALRVLDDDELEQIAAANASGGWDPTSM